jgi:TonB family protein
MKFSRLAFLALCLFLIPFSVLAQTRHTTQAFDTVPFDTSIDKLPPGYIGHSLVNLAQVLPNWERIAKKSEFETTADYQERYAKHRQALLFGRVRFNDLMAFSISSGDDDQLTAKYDADLGILTVTLKLRRDVLNDNKDDPVYTATWVDTSRTYGSYVGRNVFNRAVRVKVVRADQFNLGVCASDLEDFTELNQGDSKIGSYTSYAFQKSRNVALNMGPTQAREIKPRLRALIIGHLSDEPYSHTSDRDTPTINDPYDYYSHKYLIKVIPQEIWIYDVVSGLIYYRITPTPEPQQPVAEVRSQSTRTSRVEISGGVLNGRAIDLPKPNYPAIAKAAHASGTVTVQVTIDESGKVVSAHAVGGHPLLQQAAVQAAYKATFSPGRLNGVLTYNFYEGMDSSAASSGDDDSRTFNSNEVDVKARILSRPEPQYTEEARRNQVSGTVILTAVFSSSGQVTNIRAVSGLPDGLTERAIAAASQIRFTPAMKDGHAVSQKIRIEYNFNGY